MLGSHKTNNLCSRAQTCTTEPASDLHCLLHRFLPTTSDTTLLLFSILSDDLRLLTHVPTFGTM